MDNDCRAFADRRNVKAGLGLPPTWIGQLIRCLKLKLMELDQTFSGALFPVTWQGGLMDYWRDVLDEYGDLIIIVDYIQLFVVNDACRHHGHFIALVVKRLIRVILVSSLFRVSTFYITFCII